MRCARKGPACSQAVLLVSPRGQEKPQQIIPATAGAWRLFPPAAFATPAARQAPRRPSRAGGWGRPAAPLDAPLSLVFGTASGERQNLFVTSSGMVGALVPGLPWPGPGLAKLEIGIPGLPLP